MDDEVNIDVNKTLSTSPFILRQLDILLTATVNTLGRYNSTHYEPLLVD